MNDENQNKKEFENKKEILNKNINSVELPTILESFENSQKFPKTHFSEAFKMESNKNASVN